MRRRRRLREEGAAATEFVLITPILVVIFFGIVYIGLAVWRSQVIEAAAREGARVASLGGTVAEIEAAVDAAAFGFDPAELAVVATNRCARPFPDDTVVTVTASGNRLNYTIPFLGSYAPVFSSTATFNCELAE